MKIIKHKNLTWIDIENPTAREVLGLKEKFDLHPLVVDELTSPSQRPRAEEFDTCLYVVFHTPLFNKVKRLTYPGELDILITTDHLITIHQGENIPLKSIMQLIEKDELAKEKAFSGTVGILFYFVMEKLISSCLPKIDHINEKVDFVENEIFKGNEKEMVKELSFVKRDILAFRRILKPQRSIFESLIQKKYRFLEDNLNDYFQDLIGTNIRVWNTLENTKEVVESLEETNNSLLSYKINEAMRFLTAISLITFTLSVTVGIFGMAPIESFDWAKDQNTFWLVLIFMNAITIGFLSFFKKKRWL